MISASNSVYYPDWNHLLSDKPVDIMECEGGLPEGFCAGWWFQLYLSCFFQATDCFHSLKLDFLWGEWIKRYIQTSSQLVLKPLFSIGFGGKGKNLSSYSLTDGSCSHYGSADDVMPLLVCLGWSWWRRSFLRSFGLSFESDASAQFLSSFWNPDI